MRLIDILKRIFLCGGGGCSGRSGFDLVELEGLGCHGVFRVNRIIGFFFEVSLVVKVWILNCYEYSVSFKNVQ